MVIEKNNNPVTLPVDFCFDAQINGGNLEAKIDGASILDFSNAGKCLGQLQQPGITPDQCAVLTKRLTDLGVRAYLPTLITAEPRVLEENLKVLARFRETDEGRHCPGVHLEACFFKPQEGYIGAHPKEHTVQGSEACLNLYHRLQDAADGGIRLMTVGPDVEGIVDTIRAAQEDGVVLAIGHFGPVSDGSDPREMSRLKDCIQEAIDAGASLSTHLGNGTKAMVHRHGAHLSLQLSHPDLGASLITDGSHLPPEFINTAIPTIGREQVWLISDASPLEGAPPGRYELWDSPVEVIFSNTGFRDTCKITNPSSGYLAGSWATLPDCMNHLVDLLKAWEDLTDRVPHYSVADICYMACLNPLRALGFEPAEFEALDGAKLIFDGTQFITEKKYR